MSSTVAVCLANVPWTATVIVISFRS